MAAFCVPGAINNPEMPKRRTLNISEKIELVKFIDSCPPMKKKDIAAMYGIPLNTVSTIYSNREKLLQRSECDFSNLSKMRIRASSYPEVEEELLKWYIKTYSSSTDERPSGHALRLQALQIAKSLNIDNFSASNGWIERFKVRHNLKIHRYKTKKNPSSSINTHNGDSSFDLNKSDISVNGNSSEPECYDDVDSNVWENVSNPVMELTELKQECSDSYETYCETRDSHSVSKPTSVPSHIVPYQHVMETQTDKQPVAAISPTCSGYKRKNSDVTIKDVAEAYSVINSYIKNRRKCYVSDTTLKAMKELGSFISAEKDKKTQCKITDYFTM